MKSAELAGFAGVTVRALRYHHSDELFRERGDPATTAIAESADVSLQTLYLAWGSKHGLSRAAMDATPARSTMPSSWTTTRHADPGTSPPRGCPGSDDFRNSHRRFSMRTRWGIWLLTAVGVLTVVGPYAADWNETHISNPNWPPHAKFHNGQTMAMGAMLGVATLYFTWRRNGEQRTNLLAAGVLASLYWTSQAAANFYPGVAWTDPEFLKPGQSLDQLSPQYAIDAAALLVVAVAMRLVLGRKSSRVSNAD